MRQRTDRYEVGAGLSVRPHRSQRDSARDFDRTLPRTRGFDIPDLLGRLRRTHIVEQQPHYAEFQGLDDLLMRADFAFDNQARFQSWLDRLPHPSSQINMV